MKVCDRCGAYVTKKKKHCGVKIDLCDRCSKEFEAWVHYDGMVVPVNNERMVKPVDFTFIDDFD